MKEIDINNWCRRAQYYNFIKYTQPIFSIGTKLDVTNLVLFCKKNRLSFFSSFLYVVIKCMNAFTEWRTRIIGEKVVVFDKIHPSYIVLRESEQIITCLTEMQDDFSLFYNKTRKDIESTKNENKTVFNSIQREDLIYISCLPWINFISVLNPYNFADKSQTSIPRVTWGKYSVKNDGKYELPFDVSAHHALVDGIHVAKLFRHIEEALENLEEFIGETYER